MRKKRLDVYTLSFMAVLAAMVYIVTLLRFPLLGSKVHFANAVCLLAGMLLGPVHGGIAAGLGSAIYDLQTGYDLVNVLITFVSKFAMAWVCGMLMWKRGKPDEKSYVHCCLASVAGSLTYVALYMVKTFIYQRFVYSFAMDAVWATMLSKLIPSLINAAVSVAAAPILFRALLPPLRSSGTLARLW